MEKFKVNLFSSSFSPPSCVFGKTPRYIEYVYQQSLWDGVTLFVDECINDGSVDRVKSKYKIGWLLEPRCLHPQTYSRAIDNMDKFDVILTYDQSLLEHQTGKFQFSVYAGVWIPRDRWEIRQKTNRISMLIGGKRSTLGHEMRHMIAEALDDHFYYPDYFGTRGTSVDYSWETKWHVNAPYRYTIVTETCREDNEFTEWLLDCFALGTIPVFWGCPNIGDFFDENGVLSFETVKDLIDLYPYLTTDFYYSKMDAIKNNYNMVSEYEITDDWIYRYIIEGNYD